MKLLTVFTPTYNRGYILHKCYESLLCQTSKNFVWQIIDDGSTDNTGEIVQSFIAENAIEIVYIKKENGGKIRAINQSLDFCETEIWVCLDSDDYFTPDAVETIIREYWGIREDEFCAGLLGVRYTPDLHPMQGADFTMKLEKLGGKGKYIDFRYKHRIPPEYIVVYKTEIARKYVYPIDPAEKFMPESSAYCLMDPIYHYVILKQAVMVCEYQQDGLTSNHKKQVINNPKGYTYTHGVIADHVPYIIPFLRSMVCYQMGRCMGGEKYAFASFAKNVVAAVLRPAGYLAWKVVYKGQRK